ncbi:hypothetical protein HJC23_003539 [Cyclotella cryptica]|uniref:WW domain-containing protein n=1 Tax=Cyclotella cryptica TaxID=29204 RepID=A0ABD3P0Q8_9STRA
MSPIKNEEWTQLIVPNSGRVYFYNVTNGESRWDIRNQGGPYDGIKYSNPRPLQSDARVADHAYHNRNYRSLNSAYEYADDQYQKRRRPEYQFMTPPRADRRSRVELGSHPGSKWILDKPEESIRRDLLDMYHHHKMQESTKLLADTYEPPKHATDRTTAKTYYVHSLPARNDVEPTPQNYNKDYVRLSHDYKRMAKYRVNCESDFCPVCNIFRRFWITTDTNTRNTGNGLKRCVWSLSFNSLASAAASAFLTFSNLASWGLRR